MDGAVGGAPIVVALSSTDLLGERQPVPANYPRMGADTGIRLTDDGTKGEGRGTMTSANRTSANTRMAASCLGRTCLKWQADGELTPLDLRVVLERLAQVDQDATVLLDRTVDDLPCPSIS